MLCVLTAFEILSGQGINIIIVHIQLILKTVL